MDLRARRCPVGAGHDGGEKAGHDDEEIPDQVRDERRGGVEQDGGRDTLQGACAPPHNDVHPKSWTVNNRFLLVLSSVLHRTQSV